MWSPNEKGTGEKDPRNGSSDPENPNRRKENNFEAHMAKKEVLD